MNFLPVTIETANADGATVRLADGAAVRVARRLGADPVGARATLGIRPEHLRLDPQGAFSGVVELFERLGPLSFAHLGARGGLDTIVAQLPGDRRVTLGELLRFGVAPHDAHLFGVDGRALPPISP